ncbi:MAG: site-specific integrase, partial [Desulfatiglandales bacterium]
GRDLDKAKKAKKVRYWINYRQPDGKQKRAYVGSFKDLNGYSIEDARKANSKFEVNKAEKRLLDIKQDTEMTFRQLSDWYLDLEDIKSAPSYRIICIRLKNVNTEIGNKIVSDIKPTDLENYRAKREKQNLSDSYIDDEITAGKTVVNRAFENGMISIDTLRNFKSVKKVISNGDNARDRVLTVEEFQRLYDGAEEHLKGILLMGYWTGLRENDVLGLTWDRIDLNERIIRFTVQHRRTQKPKPSEVYIVDELFDFLSKQNNRIRKVDEDGHVFQYYGKPVQNIKRAVKTACKRAKIKYGKAVLGGFIFHDLRHTSITDMRRAGVDALVNKKWHGHSMRDAHSGYHSIDQEDLREAGKRLTEYRKNQSTKSSVDHPVDQVGVLGDNHKAK